MSTPKLLLRLEGAVTLTAALVAYQRLHGSWGWFAVLFLLPDIGMLGYLAEVRVGAACYNVVHTYAVPVAIGLGCLVAGQTAVLPWLLIWIAHLGFDRLADYGLKYPTDFKDTHLGRV